MGFWFLQTTGSRFRPLEPGEKVQGVYKAKKKESRPLEIHTNRLSPHNLLGMGHVLEENLPEGKVVA